jgi:ketosteroid isomerase-like protein
MSEANKALARDFLEALCAGDVERLKPLMREDIEAVAMGNAAICGTRRYQEIIATMSAFPLLTESGLNPRILSMTAEDDRVAVEWAGDARLRNGARYANRYAMVLYIDGGKVRLLNEYFCTKLADEVLAPLLLAAAGPAR